MFRTYITININLNRKLTMKNIFLTLAFLAHLCATEQPIRAADEQEAAKALAIQQKESQSLTDQLAATGVALQQNRGLPKVLVLGAYPSQRNHFDFPEFANNADVFCIDRLLLIHPGLATIDDMHDPHFIKADLTDIDFLNAMAAKFADRFDLITVDWSVTKSFSWNFEHISKFAELMKPGGKFIFDYSPQMSAAKSAGECLAPIITKPSDITADLRKFPLYLFRSPELKPHEDSKSVSEQIKTLMQTNYRKYLTSWVARNSTSDFIGIEFAPGILPYWNPAGPRYAYIEDSNRRYPYSYIQITKH